MTELYQWLEEKRREILNEHYNQYGEGYLDAIMDIQNRIKISSTNKNTQNEKIVWIVISNRILEVYDSFDIALERQNYLKLKDVETEIYKRPIRSSLEAFAVLD